MAWKPTNELRFERRHYSPPTSQAFMPGQCIVHKVLQQKWEFVYQTDEGVMVKEEWRDVPDADDS